MRSPDFQPAGWGREKADLKWVGFLLGVGPVDQAGRGSGLPKAVECMPPST